jgi:hypothetical protein
MPNSISESSESPQLSKSLRVWKQCEFAGGLPLWASMPRGNLPKRAKLNRRNSAGMIQLLSGVRNQELVSAPTAARRPRLILERRKTMEPESIRLNEMQSDYNSAVEAWIAAIRQEEALASVNHSVAEIDQWEHAHFHEEELRNKAKAAKKEYEGALRFKYFAIPE